jgi:uncharacterized membrane protein
MRYKTVFGIIVLLVLGFFAFAACTGFGILIGFIFTIFPLWGIVLGTLAGSLGVFLCLIGEKR